MTERQPSSLDRISDPTRQRLHALVGRLEKWNRTINLVAPGTMPDAWERHILDSAQIFDHCPIHARSWLDLGSGGGFPGLVVAILARELMPELTVELVDSDQRKCIFLQQNAQDLDLPAKVTRSRIEMLTPRAADVVSARALAPLDKLCALAMPHLAPAGICLFLKGSRIAEEIAEAETRFRFQITLHPSQTDDAGVVAQLANLSHA